MTPGYRLRIYCFIGAVFCLGTCWAVLPSLGDALALGQFDTVTGRRAFRTWEHLVAHDQPWRFTLYLLRDVALSLASGSAGLAMAWVVLRGRRAFRRWPRGF